MVPFVILFFCDLKFFSARLMITWFSLFRNLFFVFFKTKELFDQNDSGRRNREATLV